MAFHLELEAQEVQLTLQCLMKFPYHEVAPLIGKISSQVQPPKGNGVGMQQGKLPQQPGEDGGRQQP